MMTLRPMTYELQARINELEQQLAAAEARVDRLEVALLANVRKDKNQFGEPCWCDTLAGLYCVGQDKCKQAKAALRAAKEGTLPTPESLLPSESPAPPVGDYKP